MGCSALISRTETSCAIIDWSCSARSCSLALWFAGNWQEELELWWKLVFGVKSVWEVNSSNSAVSVDLYSQSLNIVGTVGSPGEIRQVELNLVPSLIESHWHCANERLHSCRRLIVRRTKPPLDTLVVENLYLECEILIEILDDHHKKRKFNANGLLGIRWTNDVVCRNIGSQNFEHRALNVLVGNSIDVSILHFGIPNLKRFRSDGIQNG